VRDGFCCRKESLTPAEGSVEWAVSLEEKQRGSLTIRSGNLCGCFVVP